MFKRKASGFVEVPVSQRLMDAWIFLNDAPVKVDHKMFKRSLLFRAIVVGLELASFVFFLGALFFLWRWSSETSQELKDHFKFSDSVCLILSLVTLCGHWLLRRSPRCVIANTYFEDHNNLLREFSLRGKFLDYDAMERSVNESLCVLAKQSQHGGFGRNEAIKKLQELHRLGSKFFFLRPINSYNSERVPI